MRRIGLGALLASVLFVPPPISAGNPLLQRIEALEAELNKQPVVIDATGLEVGTSLSGVGTVTFAFDGVPVFRLDLSRFALHGQKNLFFESADCSGSPLMEPTNVNLLFPSAYSNVVTGKTYIAETTGGVTVSTGSQLLNSGECRASAGTRTVTPNVVPVPQMEGLFTPPFQVVTRGDLIAE